MSSCIKAMFCHVRSWLNGGDRYGGECVLVAMCQQSFYFEVSSLCFACCYCIAFTIFKLFINPRYNWAPLIGASMFFMFHFAVFSLRLLPMSRGALIHARGVALAIIVDGVAFAMVHPAVQFHWVSPMLGGRPCNSNFECSEITYDFRTDGPLLLQHCLSYQVVFLAHARYSYVAPLVSICLYFGICFIAGASWTMLDITCTVLPLLVNLGAKNTLDTYQRRIVEELHHQKQEVLQEKKLRCKAEFAISQSRLPGSINEASDASLGSLSFTLTSPSDGSDRKDDHQNPTLPFGIANSCDALHMGQEDSAVSENTTAQNRCADSCSGGDTVNWRQGDNFGTHCTGTTHGRHWADVSVQTQISLPVSVKESMYNEGSALQPHDLADASAWSSAISELRGVRGKTHKDDFGSPGTAHLLNDEEQGALEVRPNAFLIAPHRRPTSLSAKQSSLLVALSKWNFVVPPGSCCTWHAALRDLRKVHKSVIDSRVGKSCRRVLPSGSFQCAMCGLFNEHSSCDLHCGDLQHDGESNAGGTSLSLYAL